jgi:hypothetical protein
MSPIASQKLLLIAESDLNRANLMEDFATLSADLQAFTGRAASVGSLTASAIGLVAGLVALQQGRSPEPPAASPWFQNLLTGTNLLAKLWRMWNPPGRER